MGNDWKDKLDSLRNLMQDSVEESEELAKDISENQSLKKQAGPLTVVLDKKGRNGKVATIIEGLTIGQDEVDNLAKWLKSKIGVGGSTREGEILLQGDQKEKVTVLLREKNFKVK